MPFQVVSGSFCSQVEKQQRGLSCGLHPDLHENMQKVRGERDKRRASFSSPSLRVRLKWMEFRAVAMSAEVDAHILPRLGCINHWLGVDKLIWQEEKTNSEEQIYRFFSLPSSLLAFSLPRGRMPWADVHQKSRQTTNGCQKPSTKPDLLTQGELKHSSWIELPSCITRRWVQTPLLLLWGHPCPLHQLAQISLTFGLR